MYKRTLAILLSILAANPTLSAPQDGALSDSKTEAFRLFTQCDESLFNALKKTPGMFGPSVRVENRGAATTISVPDPFSQSGNEQTFPAALQIAGLSVFAWHNELQYDVTLGGFLYWGFKINGEPKQVASKINALLPESRKLTRAGDLWVRSEMRLIGDPVGTWRPGGQSGTVTAKGSVERVLLVEEESPSVTTVYCSMQGSITAPLLQTIRPDLLPSEYPQ